jgi:ketopantoate reductase
MHVAVVGVGALGRAFGVRLATSGNVDVDFVTRDGRQESSAIAIERVGGERLTLDSPAYATEIPAHADVVLVCVRADQLNLALLSTLQRGPSVPVVMMTPMLPLTCARVDAALPGRLFPATTSVGAYVNASGVTRHWVSRSTATLVEEPRSADPALSGLLRALQAAGIGARFELAVHETGAATAIAALPLFLGLDAAGSIDALLGEKPLFRMTSEALKEAHALAERCGRIAPGIRALERFLGPVAIRMGLALGRRRSPEIIAFVEERFGRGGHAQNVALGAEMLALAEEKRSPCEAVRALLGRVSAVSPGP